MFDCIRKIRKPNRKLTETPNISGINRKWIMFIGT